MVIPSGPPQALNDILAGQCKDFGSLAFLGAIPGIGISTMDDDPWDVGEGLNVVDIRRFFP